MRAGFYAPVPHVVANSDALRRAGEAAGAPLSAGELDGGYQLARDFVLRAEALGFDLVLFAERHMGPDLEAWMLAAAVAPQTSRIRVMPAANPDFWHPSVLAKMALTLDRLTPGRSAINLVTGWHKQEQAAFSAVRHADDEAKYCRAEEFVTTLRALWSGQPVSQSGSFPLAEVAVPIVPAAEPPPIYAVSRSERGLDMAARVADYWFVDYGSDRDIPFDEVCRRISTSMTDMRARAERFGREVKFAINAFVLPDVDEESALRRAEQLMEEAVAQDPRLAPIQLSGLAAGLLGRPDVVRERVEALSELGIDLLLCKILPSDDDLDAVADAIRPALSDREGAVT
jgi:FMNH2-dependent dimethyl sulfone monooxygenase